jgi:hypothetical protein
VTCVEEYLRSVTAGVDLVGNDGRYHSMRSFASAAVTAPRIAWPANGSAAMVSDTKPMVCVTLVRSPREIRFGR